MIGNAFKKLANENAMSISHGVAYGSLRGYAATMFEGSGYKTIVFSTKISDPMNKNGFMDALDAIGDKQLLKLYSVNRVGMDASTIYVVFHDTVGTMKKIYTFLDWFIPLLQEKGATTANVCQECGCEIADAGSWIMVDQICHHVHTFCGEKVGRKVEDSNEQEKQERTGSYLMGTLGAFVGAALGAVVWAIVLYMGYVASIVGLLIGWLAEKGYTLLKGKQGKAKVVILIFAIIFGVLLGTIAVDVISLVGMINAGELPGFVYGDIPWMLLVMFLDSPEYLRAILSNIGLGLLFAGLGVFALLRRAGKEASGTKFIRLS